jgi:2-polyprenyl-3-methyl-5-hydroxy-6-metoxy-1,4-benzoquinol methylase
MNTLEQTHIFSLEERARHSGGISNNAIYAMVARALGARKASGVIVDVGCGNGHLQPSLGDSFSDYIGVDAVRYDDFPAAAEFCRANLDALPVPLPDGCADVIVAVETIEHLENPRALMRELVRLAKPGGWVVVTTPNQLSLLSLLTLALKHRFAAFQDVHYPAHITALLEVDLRRFAAECGLTEVEIDYSGEGRFVLTPYHYPQFLSRIFPRALSDNVLLIGKKPDSVTR